MLIAGVPFIPEVFVPYMQEATREKSAFIRSGIMTTSEMVQNEFAKGGTTCTLPFFGDLTGDDEVLNDTVGLTPANIGGGKQIGVRLARGRAWQWSDLAKELSGGDPQRAIAGRTGEYWARKAQAAGLAVLDGAFGTGGPLASSHVFGGNTLELSGKAILDGIALLGDTGAELSMIGMHSHVFYRLAGIDLSVGGNFTQSQIQDRISQENPEFGAFLNRGVVVDDGLPYDATGGAGSEPYYTTYLFSRGAMIYADAPEEVPIEEDRDSLKGINFIINRTQYMVHVNGLSWAGTPAASTPSNAELATPANWTKAYTDDKNIRVVAVKTIITP